MQYDTPSIKRHSPYIPRSASAPLRAAGLALAIVMAGTAGAESVEPPQPLVKIDDFMLNNLHFALFASQTGRDPQDPEEQLRLLNELVNNFMVANSPEGQALAKEPEVEAALEVARARLIAQTYVRSALEKSPIDEAQVKSIYDAEYAAPGVEYKARHILLENEADARDVIAALDAGKDFAELASERSTGPSKSVGGDLGWFAGDEMVSAFSLATQELADGQYSKTPVKTQFGWHVILREQSREVPPPSLESVRSEIEQQIRQEQVAKLVAAIRDKTKIEVQRLEE